MALAEKTVSAIVKVRNFENDLNSVFCDFIFLVLWLLVKLKLFYIDCVTEKNCCFKTLLKRDLNIVALVFLNPDHDFTGTL